MQDHPSLLEMRVENRGNWLVRSYRERVVPARTRQEGSWMNLSSLRTFAGTCHKSAAVPPHFSILLSDDGNLPTSFSQPTGIPWATPCKTSKLWHPPSDHPALIVNGTNRAQRKSLVWPVLRLQIDWHRNSAPPRSEHTFVWEILKMASQQQHFYELYRRSRYLLATAGSYVGN